MNNKQSMKIYLHLWMDFLKMQQNLPVNIFQNKIYHYIQIFYRIGIFIKIILFFVASFLTKGSGENLSFS